MSGCDSRGYSKNQCVEACRPGLCHPGGETAVLRVEVEVTKLFARAPIDRTDPLILPLFADLAGFPPVLIQAGSAEIPLEQVRTFQRKWASDYSNRRLTPSRLMPLSFVVQVSPAFTGNARVSVPVDMISPAARGGLSGSCASSSTR